MDMAKTYTPSEFEERIYREWEEKGYFTAKPDKNKLPYTIVMPPPNITGQLHMGHALNQTVQDALIRFKRMQGYACLWLPGVDHASIATEVKVVQKIKEEEGLTKEEVGREGFLQRAWDWKNKYGNRIEEQIRRLGSSCDWSRKAFTMDDRCSRAVKEVFVNLYEKGLIYQGNRIINWCPDCKTALSDAEVEYSEDASNFWHLRYAYEDGSGYLVVATTRPETYFGDTAVAVNPKDPRYKDIVGKNVILPLINKPIPVVADSYVDMEFGTGAVKITPAHDPNDFEVGLRHRLEMIRVMNDDGTMNEKCGEYQGMDRYDCRKKLVEDLKAAGALEKIEPHVHNVGHCYRCHSSVEPIVSKQWFVKMQPLATPAISVVKKKSLKFVPDRFSKIYYNWMENIKDWCISRQLWWGHRIPAYTCETCGEMTVSKEDITVCPKCGGTHIKQDDDVLDTWFSSALWPFSTLGFPEETEDLKYFYPTNVLVTAYDIIFFWVARMIFSGIEHMGHIPFKDVLIHGIVRDEQGRKMSKSLGNGIDPLEVISKYGADTLRFSLLNGIAAGGDTRVSEKKLEGCRNFMNKIWNASRFVMMNAEKVKLKDIADIKLSMADKWILQRLNETAKTVILNMNKYELGNACAKLYDFVWSDFCDWYIELTKPALYGDDNEKRVATCSVLVHVLRETLKLLHPFIPFVTEEIYQNLPKTKGTIMLQEYPKYVAKPALKKDAATMESVMDMIRGIRDLRARYNVVPSKKLSVFIVTDKKRAMENAKEYLIRLAGVGEVTYLASKEELTERTASMVTPLAELYISMGDLVDVEQERARITAEITRAEGEIARANGKLNNAGFMAKAPKNLVDAEKQKIEKYTELLEKLKASLLEL
ncbi:MAG: valine--tRNA ligase [Clostridiales bacterium]|nr:valine--tRNA ligase [Clostridiales bacterium]